MAFPAPTRTIAGEFARISVHQCPSVVQKESSSYAFSEMKPLVHKVIRDRLMNTVNSHPVEALTYALLERWIAARQAENRLSKLV